MHAPNIIAGVAYAIAEWSNRDGHSETAVRAVAEESGARYTTSLRFRLDDGKRVTRLASRCFTPWETWEETQITAKKVASTEQGFSVSYEWGDFGEPLPRVAFDSYQNFTRRVGRLMESAS